MTYLDPIDETSKPMNYKRSCKDYKIDPTTSLEVLEAKRGEIEEQNVDKDRDIRKKARGLAAVDRAIAERKAALEAEAKRADKEALATVTTESGADASVANAEEKVQEDRQNGNGAAAPAQ